MKLKKEGKEKDIIQNIIAVDNFIEDFLNNEPRMDFTKKTITTHLLDEEILRCLNG